MGEISLPLGREVEVETLYDERCGWDLWGLGGGRKDWGERAGGWGVGREREDGWERGRVREEVWGWPVAVVVEDS